MKAVLTVLKREPGLDSVSRAQVHRHLRDLLVRTDVEAVEPSAVTPGSLPASCESLGESGSVTIVEGAVGLNDLAAGKMPVTGRKPVALRLPGAETVAVRNWVGVAEAVVQWLARVGKLPALPWPVGERTYFLNSTGQHSDRPMHRAYPAHLPDGGVVFVDVNRSGITWVRSLNKLCEEVQIAPADLALVFQD